VEENCSFSHHPRNQLFYFCLPFSVLFWNVWINRASTISQQGLICLPFSVLFWNFWIIRTSPISQRGWVLVGGRAMTGGVKPVNLLVNLILAESR
jgi:hypothetical protein